MANIEHIFGGSWSPPMHQSMQPAPPEVQLRKAMEDVGFDPPDVIYMDGKIHRFSSGLKKDKAAWYVLYGEGIPAGSFGNWRDGDQYPFRADIGRKLTDAESMANTRRMAEARALRDAEMAKTREVASNVVDLIWSDGQLAESYHPYLAKKGIKPNGARVTGDGRLMVPLYSQDGEISSIQYISADGEKKYHPGGETKGKFWSSGSFENAKRIYFAEGFATSSTIHETTNDPCVICYSASNIVPVVGIFREMMGRDVEFVIVADNDKSGVGQKYADQASAKYGARVIMPPIEGDANDYAAAGFDLNALLKPTSNNEIITKLKAIFGNEISNEFTPPNELIEGLLTIGGLAVIYGDSNSGKTFFALSIAHAVATGYKFHDRHVDKGLVIYLATEAPASVITRIQALKRYYSTNLDNLIVIPVPINFYDGDGDSNDVIQLVKAVEEKTGKPARLIIGDTLARMSAGANENSGEDMGPIMARFDQVAQATGAALAIIHHNGKDQAKGARGWSGIRAHIDTEIEVTQVEDVRSATITKQRELPGKGDALHFSLHIMEMGIGKFGNVVTTCVAIPGDAPASSSQSKESKATINHMLIIRDAWLHAKMESREGYPYISRSALKEYLFKQGKAKQTIDNYTNENDDKKLLGQLLSDHVITKFEHGYTVINPEYCSQMMLLRV